ncbi:MAG: TRAP transporter small permease [Beijerinckiaceae bacterium]
MYQKIIRLIDQTILAVGSGLLITLLATVTAGIVTRGLGNPLVWTDEASGYLMVWLSMLGWMVATRRAAHIRIRFFQQMLPNKGRRGLEAVFLLLAALFGAVVIVQGVHLVRTNSDVESITMPISIAWLYLPLIPAGLVTLGQALTELVNVYREPNLSENSRIVESLL